jgi:predicted AAA+ superfamily ATPase
LHNSCCKTRHLSGRIILNQLLRIMKIDYKGISMTDLVDLLAQKTQKFTQLMSDKSFNEEYTECKKVIQEILEEMELRKHIGSASPEKQGLPTENES